MQADAVRRIPDPDYDRHPAYGGLFGPPKLSDRLAALRQLLPQLAAYAAWDVLARLRRAFPDRTGAPSPVFDALSRDGVTMLRLSADEMATIQEAIAPFIVRLRAKLADPAAESAIAPAPAALASTRHNSTLSALHKQFNPRSAENELFIHEEMAPALFAALRAALTRQGALAAASRYQGRPLDVTFLKLLFNRAEDTLVALALRRCRPGRSGRGLDACRPSLDHQGDPLSDPGRRGQRAVLLLPRQQPHSDRLARGRRPAGQRPGQSVLLQARAPPAVPRAAQAASAARPSSATTWKATIPIWPACWRASGTSPRPTAT